MDLATNTGRPAGGPPSPADAPFVRLTIDGLQVTAREGQTVLEVARAAGSFVPSLCYDPRIGQAALCRVCVAEVEGMKGLQTTCSLPVRDGMVVRTDSPLALEARRMNVTTA
jgi:NADH dehydrogenase/NADH:ubiquinone oxidoreductase subunit G